MLPACSCALRSCSRLWLRVVLRHGLRLLVLLTAPLTEEAGGSHTVRPEFLGILNSQLQSIKAAACHDSFLSLLMTAFVDALARHGSDRAPEDDTLIQYTLLVLKNLLLVPNPRSSRGDAAPSASLNEQFLLALEEVGLAQALITMAALSEERDNAEHTMFLLDTLAALVGGVDAEVLAEAAAAEQQQLHSAPSVNPSTPSAAPEADPLALALGAERAARSKAASGRHSRFTGLFTKHVQGAGRMVVSHLGRGAAPTRQPARKPQRRKRYSQTDTPPAAGASSSLTTRVASHLSASGRAPLDTSGIHHEARMVLYNWGLALLESAYPRLVRIVLRRLSLTTVTAERDRRNYMALATFALCLQRCVASAQVKAAQAALPPGGKLAPEAHFTMGNTHVSLEYPTLKLVLQVLDEALGGRQYDSLHVAVALLKEFMTMAAGVLDSAHPKAELVAESLRRGALAEADTLDVVPHLLAKYEPGRFTTRFLTALVAGAHAVVRAVGALARSGVRVRGKRRRRRRASGRSAGELGDGAQYDEEEDEVAAEAAMRRVQEREVSLDAFLVKFANAHTVEAYTTLLAHYRANTPTTNRHIAIFMHRLSTLPNPKAGVSPSEREHRAWEKAGKVGPEPPAPRMYTFEPMWWSLPALRTYHRLLGDRVLVASPVNADLVRVVRRLVRHFAAAAMADPLIFVEALVKRDRAANGRIARGYTPLDQDASGGRGPSKRELADARVEREIAIARALDDDDADEAEFDAEQEERVWAPLEDPELTKAKKAEAAQRRREASGAPKRRQKDSPTQGSGRAGRWTAAQDALLAQHYPRYAGMDSVFELLAAVPELEAAGRTATQVARRVKHLRLHVETPAATGPVLGPATAAYTQATAVAERLGGSFALHSDSTVPAEVTALPAAAVMPGGFTGITADTATLRGVATDGGGVRAVLWVRQQLHRVLCARHLRGGPDAAPTPAADPACGEVDGTYMGAAGVWEESAEADFALVPLHAAEFAWCSKAIVTALLREVGARPPSGPGKVWWRFPGHAPTPTLLQAASGLDALLLRLPRPVDAAEAEQEPSPATPTKAAASPSSHEAPPSAGSGAGSASGSSQPPSSAGSGAPSPAKRRRRLRAAVVDSDSDSGSEAEAARLSQVSRPVDEAATRQVQGKLAAVLDSDEDEDLGTPKARAPPPRVLFDDEEEGEEGEHVEAGMGGQREAAAPGRDLPASQVSSIAPSGTIFDESDDD